jgi:hypothetical protein
LSYAQNLFVLVNVELKHAHNFSVIFEGFVARRFFTVRDQGNTADLEKFRSREENHLDGEVQYRISDTAFIQDQMLQTVFLCFDSGCKTGRPSANHHEIE